MSVRTWFSSPSVGAVLALVSAAAILCGAPPAAADEPPPQPDRAWFVELALGEAVGGPADDLEDAMRAAGLDDYMEDWLGGNGSSYPRSSDEGTSLWGAAGRRLGDSRWSVGLGFGRTELGTVSGNRNIEGEPPGSFHIYSEVEMLTLAPVAWFKPVPAVRLGAGLALNRVDTQLGRSYTGNLDDESSWEPGLLVEAAVNAPVASRFYFLAVLQYRWLDDGTMGPWQETASTGEVVAFPETEVELAHGYYAVGLGVRF